MAMEIERVGELTNGTGTTLAVGPDGNITVAAGNGRAAIWAGNEHAHAVALAGYTAGPVAFSADGKTARIGDWAVDVSTGAATPSAVDIDLLTSGIDFAERAPTRFYSPRAAAQIGDASRLVSSFVFAPSRGIGDDVANVGPDGQVALFDPGSARLVAVLEGISDRPHDRALAIDARHVVAAGSAIHAWSSNDGSAVGQDATDAPMRSDVRISPDGTLLAASRVDGSAELRSFADFGSARIWTAHSKRATAVAFHPTLPLLATGGEDQQVKVWSIGAGAPELMGWFWVERDVKAIAFHTYGEHLLIAAGPEVIVTELAGLH